MLFRSLPAQPLLPMGWEELPDLTSDSDIKPLIRAAYPEETPERIERIRERVWNFIGVMEREDLVGVPLLHAHAYRSPGARTVSPAQD